MKIDDIDRLLNQGHLPDPSQQVAAMQQLIRLDAKAAIPLLIELLASQDTTVRFVAAQGLGRLGNTDVETAGQALINLLADPESLVRSEAVEALGLLHYTDGAGQIQSLLLNDPAPIVRASAAESLGDFGDAHMMPALLSALEDDDDSVRAYAANAIGLLGDFETIALLQTHLEWETVSRVRAELYGARYRLGATGDLDNLVNLLATSDEELAWPILNLITDLIERRPPLSLPGDTPKIRIALTSLAQRLPVLRSQIDEMLTLL